MIRFIFRVLGFLILAGAFVVVIYDGARSIAADEVLVSTGERIWAAFLPAEGRAPQTAAEGYVPGWLGTAVIRPLMQLPLTPVLAALGATLMLVGGKKKQPTG